MPSFFCSPVVPHTPQALRDLSISLNNVGQVERDLGDLEAARSAYRESLEIVRRLARTFPDQPQYQQDLAWIEARAGTIHLLTISHRCAKLNGRLKSRASSTE